MAKKITQEQVDKIIERLNQRVQKANEVFLKNVGKSIDEMNKLTPSNAHQLQQILKYGGNYENIVKQIDKYTTMNIQDIDKIFKEYAKKDGDFYEQFYKYRDIPFTEYENNQVIMQQTQAIANMVKNEMYDFTRANVLGYSFTNPLTKVVEFHNLRDTYNTLLDTAMVNVGQGKETFDEAMKNILKEVGGSGLRTMNYESGRSVRLDSVVRMHLQSRLAELHNENQKIYGEQFGADGYEITVHANPAPDHEEAQGRQFSLEEYDNLQRGLVARDYMGNEYCLDHDGKGGYRPIGELNCYHYTFSIVLGVSKPEYNDEQLKQIQEDNEKGFEFEGKHYTNYEGTQLQRAIEREVRKQKDIQITARKADNKPLIAESQTKITQLSNKYKELSKVSGLPTFNERMSVSGYKRIKTEPTINKSKPEFRTLEQWQEYFGEKYGSFNVIEGNIPYNNKYKNWLDINDDLKDMDKDILNDNLTQLNKLYDKYNLKEYGMSVDRANTDEYRAMAFGTSKISYANKMFKDKDTIISEIKDNIDKGFYMKVNKGNESIYPITHEMGHIVENKIIKVENIIERSKIDQEIKNNLLTNVSKKTNLTFSEIEDKYLSKYARSRKSFEWFAETFTQLELGKKNIWTEEFEKWLKTQL